MHDRTTTLQKTSLAIGDVLNDRYVIENVIDRGGMGIVLGARHIRLNERVAIKILLPESSKDPHIVARFIREGQMVAQLKSDHIVRVRDVDVTPDGMAYLVMEWLDGQDLKSFCRSRKTDAVEIGFAVRCILEACDALEEAHARGIVHRDIKPSNLFLARGPRGTMRIKLIDFGISKQENGFSDFDERTKTGAMLGTTEYMGPEQIRASNRVDGRADIWSLGVTLYKLVTGRTPFRAGEQVGTCALILSAEPIPPHTVRPELPPILEAVILKCLEKNPEQRYATVRELARALAPFAEREEKTVLLEAPPVSTRRQTTVSTQVIPAKPRRHRVWGLVAAIAPIATVAMVVGNVHRAEATVPEARRIASVWHAPATTTKPPVVEAPLATATASSLPSAAPAPIPQPTSTGRVVQSQKTPVKQPEIEVIPAETPKTSRNIVAPEDHSTTPNTPSSTENKHYDF